DRASLQWEKKNGKLMKNVGFLLAAERGIYYEPQARTFFQDWFPEEKFMQSYAMRIPGTILHPTSPLCCSPDAMLIEEKNPGSYFGLEIKVPWKKPQQILSELPTLPHYVQVQMCLAVTDAPAWYMLYYDPAEPKESVILWVDADTEVQEHF